MAYSIPRHFPQFLFISIVSNSHSTDHNTVVWPTAFPEISHNFCLSALSPITAVQITKLYFGLQHSQKFPTISVYQHCLQSPPYRSQRCISAYSIPRNFSQFLFISIVSNPCRTDHNTVFQPTAFPEISHNFCLSALFPIPAVHITTLYFGLQHSQKFPTISVYQHCLQSPPYRSQRCSLAYSIPRNFPQFLFISIVSNHRHTDHNAVFQPTAFPEISCNFCLTALFPIPAIQIITLYFGLQHSQKFPAISVYQHCLQSPPYRS